MGEKKFLPGISGDPEGKAENPVAKELRLRVGVQDRRGEGTVHIDLWRVAVIVFSGEQRERNE